MPKLDLAFFCHIGIMIFLLPLFFFAQGSPLLGTLGFESANLLVTLVGPFFCLTAALNQRQQFLGILARELLWVIAYIVLYGGLLYGNGLFATSCSEGAGIVPFLIVGAPPLLLNISIGSLIASLFGSRLLKATIVILGYAAYFSLVIFIFWHEMSFRVITQASILITSDLLQGDHVTPAVIEYRMSTILLTLAIMVLGAHITSKTKSKKSLINMSAWALVSVLIFTYLVLDSEGRHTIGKDRSVLLHDYLLLARYDNLNVYANPLKTNIKQAQAILDEARYYQYRLADSLGQLSKKPIIIWLHASDEDKFLYTGAKNVHFALPKQREIHISGFATPHPVLGHELAHIFVGEFTHSFTGLPGESAFIPNLALTEGIPVALTKELYVHNGLTLFEQAQALYRADIRVDLNQLFSNNPITFAKTNSRVAYIYAGALIDFLLTDIKASERPKRLQTTIRSGSIVSLLPDDETLSETIQLFLDSMNAPISHSAMWWAKKSFKESSILLADCGDKLVEKDQFERAIINNDPISLATVLKRLPARKQLQLVSHGIDQALSVSSFDVALDLIAVRNSLPIVLEKAQAEELKFKSLDALIGVQDLRRARDVIDDIDNSYFLPFQRRLLLALRIFLRDFSETNSVLSKNAVLFLFSKTSDHDAKLADFSYSVGKTQGTETLAISEADLIAQYVFARSLMRYQQYQEALSWITTILQHKNQLPSIIERETQAMFAVTNAALKNYGIALTTFQHLIATSMNEAEKEYLNDQIHRMRFALQN